MLWLKNNPLMEFFEMRKHLEKHPHTEVGFYERRPRYVACERYYTSVVAELEEQYRLGVPPPPEVN